jgi:hypothetical protein
MGDEIYNEVRFLIRKDHRSMLNPKVKEFGIHVAAHVTK